jgi:hypothetical protein
MLPDDLAGLKGDMIAFIEGHGLRRFRGLVDEDISTVSWDAEDKVESWKDFVEVAKASGAAFITMSDFVLERQELDQLVEHLEGGQYTSPEDLEEAKWLRAHVGQTGFIQLGLPHQGVVFIYEIANEWYERYQRLLDFSDECGNLSFDEPPWEDEH